MSVQMDSVELPQETGHSSRSLAISPNLDALLEHDDRTRRSVGGWSPGSVGSSSPLSAGAFNTTFPIPLPPPPRGPKKTRASGLARLHPAMNDSRLSQCFLNVDLLAVESPSPSSVVVPPNPFINKAPSLDELNLSDQLSPAKESVEEDERPQGDDPMHMPSDSRTNRNADRVYPKQPSSSSNHRSYPSLPRVDKLLTRGKTALGLFSDSPSQSHKVDGAEVKRASTSSLVTDIPSFRERVKGKLVKREASSPTNEMRQVSENSKIIDIRKEDGQTGVADFAMRQSASATTAGHIRPLISSHGSARSSTSSSVAPSDSTHNPASTAHEPRISISSTIYTASSHSRPFYSQPSSPVVLPPEHINNFTTRRNMPSDNTSSRESFIDLMSPAGPQSRHSDSAHLALRQLHTTTLDEYRPSRSRSPKPPIPTTPKPLFNRSSSIQPLSKSHSPPSPNAYDPTDAAKGNIPPTTNFLSPYERADLIRKHRKLAQVFGQAPSAGALHAEVAGYLAVPAGAPKHHHAMSVSHDLPSHRDKKPSWPPTEGTRYMSANGRRHSIPLTPDEFSFLSETASTEDNVQVEEQHPRSYHGSYIEIGTLQIEGEPASERHESARIAPGSPTSFIDLSDGEDGDTIMSSETPRKHRKSRRDRDSLSPSSRSLFENMTPEQQAEETRRRKREKLAKLHRFLGSRVPTNLVLGLDDNGLSFQPPHPPQNMISSPDNQVDVRKAWLRRRRSSSAGAFPSTWLEDLDRIKEDLDDKEKAINVRRAQKMEKVFGVAPPQTLYHTRHSPSPSNMGSFSTSGRHTGHESSGDQLPPSLSARSTNQLAYFRKPSKDNRPGTSESSKQLLPNKGRDSFDLEGSNLTRKNSYNVYNHYQHSLQSLNDIIDREDTESLAELRQYINGDIPSFSPPLKEFSRAPDRRLSNAASIKSERRRSLPARTSMASLSSEYSITTPAPETTDFQMRRRRAAKLTHFFGEDYTILIKDVLESIEKGVEEERNRGTLNADQVEDLLQKLRTLKTKRGGLL